MIEYWTDNFEVFRKKVESIFGNIRLLAKNEPDIYCHQVIAHGFLEYVGVKKIKGTKDKYLEWFNVNKLEKTLQEEGWKEYQND